MTRFRQVYIEITNVCNLRCAFCPGTPRPPAFMPVDRFAGLLPLVAPLTGQIYLHVLGEPLLHPDFAAMIALAGQAGVPVSITTNGTLMASPAAAALLAPGVRQVNISLHSLYGESDDAVRAQRLRDILDFTRQAFAVRPDLYINYRLWNFETARHSAENDLNTWICRTLAETFAIPEPTVAQAAGCKTRRLLNRLYLDLDTRFEWPTLTPGAPEHDLGYCHGLTGQLAILVDGTVVPCCLDRDGVINFGNVFETPLDAILASPRVVAMYDALRAGRLVEPLCRQCTFRMRFALPRKA